MITLKEIIFTGTGGFVGSALRYTVSALMLSASIRNGFPLGTLLVNVCGSFLAGVFIMAVPAGHWQHLAIVGFCGGFTTFSAFSLESLRLMRNGDYGTAGLYIGVSVALCLLFVWLGAVCGAKFFKTAI